MTKTKLLSFFVLFLFCLNTTIARSEASEYDGARLSLIDAWLRLDSIKSLPCIYAQQSIADELVVLYRESGKEDVAKFIESQSPHGLREWMHTIQADPEKEFPKYKSAPHKMLVQKVRNGSFTYRFPSTCSHHCVRFDSPDYSRVSKLVGAIEIGETKEIEPLPYGILLRNPGSSVGPLPPVTENKK